jgi:hypothetical protein
MKLNAYARCIMENFEKTGTLGKDARREELEGVDAFRVLNARTYDCLEIAALDNRSADCDATPGVIELACEEALKHVPDDFGPVTSFCAEFEGPTEDPGELTASIMGPDSRRIVHFSVSGDTLCFFEARANVDEGLVTAGMFTMDTAEKSVRGYLEELQVPWHLAR